MNLKQQRPDLFTLTGQPRKRKEEPPVKPQEKTGKGALRCPHHFGYLANRPKNASISEGCLICSKLLECIMLETSNIIWLEEWDLNPLMSGDVSRQLPFFCFGVGRGVVDLRNGECVWTVHFWLINSNGGWVSTITQRPIFPEVG